MVCWMAPVRLNGRLTVIRPALVSALLGPLSAIAPSRTPLFITVAVPTDVIENDAEITPLLVSVSPAPMATPVAEQPLPSRRPELTMVDPEPSEVSMPMPQAPKMTVPEFEITALLP